jgi:tRNA(Ser,Leu) C12 N-acetylase TAN1
MVMKDWNVVVTTTDGGYDRACALLRRLGKVNRTRFYNVLVMQVPDPHTFLDRLEELTAEHPELPNVVARVLPLAETFDFVDAEEFDRRAREVAHRWARRLAGCSFHVRFHRRGLKDEISAREEERRIAEEVLGVLGDEGVTGAVCFENPDAVIDVETVEDRAGMSVWTRDDLERHRLLHID